MSAFTFWVIIGVIAIGLVYFSRNEGRLREEAIENIFRGRERYSSEQFYAKYFEKKGVPAYIVFGIKEVLEFNLDADLSRLIDEDDFSNNLNSFWEFDSMADVEIIMMLEEKFNIKIKDSEAEKTLTVKDMVYLVWEKVDGKV